MNIATMANSKLRPMVIPTDVDAYTKQLGGHLGGTMHCARYLGTRLVWDSTTDEFITEEGVAHSGLEHLSKELMLVNEKMIELTGNAVHADGVLIPVQKGNPHFRIYDLISANPEAPLTLWKQINILADLFSTIDKDTFYTRPVQYFHTAKMSTETRIARWLKTWTKRPGCGGVIFKTMESINTPNAVSETVCMALPVGRK